MYLGITYTVPPFLSPEFSSLKQAPSSIRQIIHISWTSRMEGLMEFCYKPVLPSVRENFPANSTFQVWYNNDFGLCFEYLVFATFLNALFGVTRWAP